MLLLHLLLPLCTMGHPTPSLPTMVHPAPSHLGEVQGISLLPHREHHRTKRTIDILPTSFFKISLLGARFQVLPQAPLGADNFVLFDVKLEVPKALAFLIPGQG